MTKQLTRLFGINPTLGFRATSLYHWFWALLLMLTPFVLLVCLLTIFIGGWFIAIMWCWLVAEVTPTEIEDANNAHRQAVKKAESEPVTRVIPKEYEALWSSRR